MKKIIFVMMIVSCIFGTIVQAFSLNPLRRYIHHDDEKAKEVLMQLLYKKIRDFKSLQISHERDERLHTLQNNLLEHYPSLRSSRTSKNDNGLTKYVGSGVFYTNKIYKPKDLKEISTNYFLTTTDDTEQVREKLHEPLNKLAKAYYRKFKKPLNINSARRSYFYQQNHFEKECFDEKICAVPGTSEHQNGYTVDISHMYGDEYQWMKTHAHEYGFHQSYQKSGDGLQIEPWHRRYLGIGFATYLYTYDLSFTDRYISGGYQE